MWCWASVDKANKDLDEAVVVFRLLRMTFGDQSASAFLELALRDILAPLCKTALEREIGMLMTVLVHTIIKQSSTKLWTILWG